MKARAFDITGSAVTRLLARTEFVPGACWNWNGLISEKGYGLIDVAGSSVRVHRLAFAIQNGYWPDCIDHTCKNKRCVNPSHLEAVTVRLNTLRGTSPAAVNSAKTHCPLGHPLSGENLVINSRLDRVCRACTQSRLTRLWNKRKALQQRLDLAEKKLREFGIIWEEARGYVHEGG